MLPESEANSQVDWTYDPNEPRYCICNQVSAAATAGLQETTLHLLEPPAPPSLHQIGLRSARTAAGAALTVVGLGRCPTARWSAVTTQT